MKEPSKLKFWGSTWWWQNYSMWYWDYWSIWGDFLKWWVSPTTMGFPTKNDHFGIHMWFNMTLVYLPVRGHLIFDALVSKPAWQAHMNHLNLKLWGCLRPQFFGGKSSLQNSYVNGFQNWIGGIDISKLLKLYPAGVDFSSGKKKKHMLGKIGTYITHFDLPTHFKEFGGNKNHRKRHRPNEIAAIPKCLWGLASSAFMVGMPGSFFLRKEIHSNEKYGPKWLFGVYGWNTTQL